MLRPARFIRSGLCMRAQTIVMKRFGVAAILMAGACLSALACGADGKSVPDLSGLRRDRDSISIRPHGVQKPEGDDNNPILQPWAAKIVKQWPDETHAGRAPDHAHARCYPTSVPGVITLHNGSRFLQEKTEVTIIVANQAQVRHIYLDVPHSEHVTPSWYGESVGHYEGDTLVVDTIGIKPNDVVPIERFGTTHTDRLHVVERIRKSGRNELRISYETASWLTPRPPYTHPFHILWVGELRWGLIDGSEDFPKPERRRNASPPPINQSLNYRTRSVLPTVL
jgi:hypothetical protein